MDNWVQLLKIGKLQLNTGVVVVFSVSEIYQIIQNSYFEVMVVIKLRVKCCAVLKVASVQSC